MLKQLLLILILISLPACTLFAEVQEGVYGFKPVNLSNEGRELWERDKRESLDIVDFRIGNGPLAAWSRRFDADVEIRYLDGTVVYNGRIFYYLGFENADWPRRERGMLRPLQYGIIAGINGMAIGGQRRITINNPLLVCNEPRQINSEATCLLTEDGTRVYQRPLIVEATLTESCIPQVIVMPSIASGGHANEVGCRRSETPQRQPDDPIWKLY